MPHAPLTPATFHVLLALAEAPSHGYAIKRAVEERTEGAVRLGPGTLYAALARLVDEGLVRRVAPGRPAPVKPGPPGPLYELTAGGRATLRAEIARLETDVRSARAVLGRKAARGGAR